ncbi:MAG: hypothetical protein HDR51_04875 [Treponema sp.]|nr:hypothetical protein [Treponema sp.]MDE6244890.1 hypothetical protein [Treponemataceae bacterium]MBD5404827.1 hypothetical protein [Treponema sp.]MBD5410319.1 hypothetical protein [Treponema sp.]MBD5412067.1 hypothetical protein [Treponema sp.]
MNSILNEIENREDSEGFIKVTDNPVSSLNPNQKVLLNRKGNALFNEGKVEEARRIFTTTGYSDGLTRIGDTYSKDNRSIDALKQYILAHNKTKAEPIYEDLATIISSLLKNE